MEHILTPKVEEVKLLERYTAKKPATGTLYLTATHLIFVETSCNSRKETWAFLYNPKQDEDERRHGWGFIDSLTNPMGMHMFSWLLLYKGTVLGSAKFRSRGRILTLLLPQAAICRSSQPLSGLNARCVEDEEMLQAISRANPKSTFMYVVDTRPKLNAMANRAAGKWYENEDNYSNICFQFVENIHVMRNSLQKLLEVCAMKSPTMSDYLTGLENSSWLRHIKAVMDAGVFLAKEKASMLVHCSDGWDRTAQVCSLASILLDPFYRTIKGLMVLIEKGWICMGHKFTQRCGHVDGDPKEMSPIFTQFIECLSNLMEQYPCGFEEREEMRLKERTFSVWPFLWEKCPQYRNPLYKRSLGREVLRPSTLPLNFKYVLIGFYTVFNYKQFIGNKYLTPLQNMT
uniref:Myotubularin related protein 8 n=1 Tax=Hucho hucho TaxID=62062 RepID=A0A4W5LI64_9TELE